VDQVSAQQTDEGMNTWETRVLLGLPLHPALRATRHLLLKEKAKSMIFSDHLS